MIGQPIFRRYTGDYVYFIKHAEQGQRGAPTLVVMDSKTGIVQGTCGQAAKTLPAHRGGLHRRRGWQHVGTVPARPQHRVPDRQRRRAGHADRTVITADGVRESGMGHFKTQASTFSISAAPTGRARCRACKKVVGKGELRMSSVRLCGPGDGRTL